MTTVIKGDSNINLDFSTGGRITGDFSNSTLANRAIFQSSTTNGASGVIAIPNGTGVVASWSAQNSSDPNNGTNISIRASDTDMSVRSGILGTGSYLPMTFYTGGSERMRLDTSGNLGLGVTPGTWSRKAIQIGGGGSAAYVVNSSGTMVMGTNARFNSGDFYINNGNAALYAIQDNGVHAWLTAPSGTAGNAISFTQAMTLDASGNLGVGTTSPSVRLEVNGASEGEYFRAGGGTISARSLQFSSFTVSGLTGVGHQINVPNANGVLSFATGSTERARIDSSGNLLVGMTSASDTTIGAYVNKDANSGRFTANGNNGTNGAGFLVNRTDTAAAVFLVRPNGNVLNANNSYGSLSDSKLKENIVDVTPKLEKLNQVRVVNYNLIGDERKQIGVIAQELETVFPSMVEEANDMDSEGNDLGTTTKSVKYSVFVPMLIKAIQEQQALIQTLTARVAALEGVQP